MELRAIQFSRNIELLCSSSFHLFYSEMKLFSTIPLEMHARENPREKSRIRIACTASISDPPLQSANLKRPISQDVRNKIEGSRNEPREKITVISTSSERKLQIFRVGETRKRSEDPSLLFRSIAILMRFPRSLFHFFLAP